MTFAAHYRLMKLAAVLALSIGFFAGCQKPGPVELQDPLRSEIDEVQPILPSATPDLEADTTGLLAPDQAAYFGQLVVTGVRFDLPAQTHTVSLARVILLDKTQPVLRGGTTIGYRSMDIGTVFIDGLPLYKIPKRIRFRLAGSTVDTVVGVQYTLVSKDGVGGRGFRFTAEHGYDWTNAYTGPVSLNVRSASAREVVVRMPVAGQFLSQRQDLSVEWSGGEEYLRLIISAVIPNNGSIPLLRMRIRSGRRQVAIPAKILQLLPADRFSWYILSFVSERRSGVQVQGYPDPVLVYSASIHNILVNVQR